MKKNYEPVFGTGLTTPCQNQRTSGKHTSSGRLRTLLAGMSVMAASALVCAQAAPLNTDITREAAETGVVYDLDILDTWPAKGAVDMSEATWNVTLITVAYDYNYRPGAKASLCNSTGTFEWEGELENSSFTADTRTFKLISLYEPIENGTYTLTIPQGTFGDAAWLENPETGHSNPEIKVAWRVYGARGTVAEYDLEVASTTPADNGSADITDNPLAITVTAPGELDFVPGIYGELVNEESHYHGKVYLGSPLRADGMTTFQTTVNPPVVHNGTYTLTIPEGAFGDLPYAQDSSQGHGNKAYTMSFEVTGGKAPMEPVKYDLSPEITPADGTDVSFTDVQRLVFIFPEGTNWVDENTAKAALRCQTANYYSSALFRRDPEVSGSFYLAFGTKPFREGTYTLVLNQGIFMTADKTRSNPEITYTWNVKSTGIDTVGADEEAATAVYDLGGTYKGDTLEGLPAGIYVVKGRKITVNGK